MTSSSDLRSTRARSSSPLARHPYVGLSAAVGIHDGGHAVVNSTRCLVRERLEAYIPSLVRRTTNTPILWRGSRKG